MNNNFFVLGIHANLKKISQVSKETEVETGTCHLSLNHGTMSSCRSEVFFEPITDRIKFLTKCLAFFKENFLKVVLE